MQYYGLKSIVASQKVPVSVKGNLESFVIPNDRPSPFIEPCFSKLDFPTEKPSILLVSAVGASGKTTTARALSHDSKLPILDLALHKAVGDNTLTGLITTAFPIEQVSRVLEGLCSGTYGVIIDGIDEGRSKTTEEGFEAFLDDLIERSKNSPCTSIVVFGRGQVLLNTWCYLCDKGASVGLVSIDPFSLDQARDYIDAQVPQRNPRQQANYERARDSVLDKLDAAFSSSSGDTKDAFLSFVGYPPVLDAIGTLLRQESNYHRVEQELTDDNGTSIEISLLVRICDYLMAREHDDKAVPNFIDSIAQDAESITGQDLRKDLYNQEEQCARVLSHALARPFARQLIGDRALNERYEKAVATWCPDHPFLHDTQLRNPVFAAAATARCVLSVVPEYRELAFQYVQSHSPTYHFLYIMDLLGEGHELDIRCFNVLMQSSCEFLGVNAEVFVEVEGASWEDAGSELYAAGDLIMRVEFPDKQQHRVFTFSGCSTDARTIMFGPNLVNAGITLPCDVELSGHTAVEAIGNCSISARQVSITAPDLIVRSMPRGTHRNASQEFGLFIDTREASGHVDRIPLGADALQIQCRQHTFGYPLASHTHIVPESNLDDRLRDKYLRLRRILLEFRSHSRGQLAKYRDKIEHERVLRNDLGRAVLEALIRRGVLTSDSRFYYVDHDALSAELGITWHELRQHQTSRQLEVFLQAI